MHKMIANSINLGGGVLTFGGPAWPSALRERARSRSSRSSTSSHSPALALPGTKPRWSPGKMTWSCPSHVQSRQHARQSATDCTDTRCLGIA